MRIALLISGRAARYEVCLLPILEECKYDYEFHIFMSINDTDALYYEKMRERLSKYLKKLYIHPYSLPDGFQYRHPGSRWNFQKIHNEYLPYNIMSMYWNDSNAFTMAVEYAKEQNIRYDLFMKFRTDITETSIPELIEVEEDVFELFSIFPSCHFTSNGLYKEPIVSDAWAWGTYKTMKIYCNTYNYVVVKNKELDGSYFICFESSLTDNIVEHQLPYTYVRCPYKLDAHRRIFDKSFERDEQGSITGGDIRQGQLKECHNYIDPRTIDTTTFLEVLSLT